MNQKGFANIIVIIIGVVILVGAAGYFIVSQQLSLPEPVPSPAPTPTPTPEPTSTPTLTPDNTQAIRFEASPTLGAPPLSVSFGAFSPDPLQFDEFSIEYGDGFRDFPQQQCIGGICQIRTNHIYTSSGTFSTTLRGIRNGSSQILGTLTIAVGNPLSVTKTVGEKESTFLIQKINRGSVEGLWYEAYPIATGEGTPKTLHIGDDIGYACEGVSDKLTSIDFSGQRVTFTISWEEPPFGWCPRCLAGDTLIDTPLGLVPVKDLQVDMSVWTADQTGQRVPSVITKTSKVSVPPTHQMVHLVLDDGRDLRVSPSHPTTDGRTVGDLMTGDLYDGSSVIGTERVSYGESATYDILPSGDTGFYWADGILLDSTLR